MTEKIYYTNSYKQEITARIINQKTENKVLWLQLDKNLFYPGGGGQSADKGKINNWDLREIVEDNGILWHGLNTENTIQDGQDVLLQLDWPARYQNMQQHSGQHLISHVLWEKNLKTVSVHLGDSYTMIEVEGDFPDEQIMQQIEDETNRLIREALPIKTFIADRRQAEALPLRKPAGDWAELRIVQIGGLDYSACGGIHVNNTSEIGLVKYIGIEKIRGHARLKFVTGGLAYVYFSKLYSIMNQLKESLQTDPEQFPEKVDGLVNNLNTLKKENNHLKNFFIHFQCNQILGENNPDSPVIIKEFTDGDFDDLKEIGKQLAGDHGKICFIYGDDRFTLCAPENSVFNTTDFIRKHGSDLGLKGGGPPGFAQGTCGKIDEDKLVKIINKDIKNI